MRSEVGGEGAEFRFRSSGNSLGRCEHDMWRVRAKQSNTDLCLAALKVESEAGRCGAPPLPRCAQAAAGPEVCRETSPVSPAQEPGQGAAPDVRVLGRGD